MRGKTKVGERRWDSMRSFARDLERQHGLRRRAQDCAETFRRSAWELLSAAMECFGAISWEAVRRQGRIAALPRDLCKTWDEADDLMRAKSAQVKYAASSAKEPLCRANEAHGISERVAAAAVVGGITLLEILVWGRELELCHIWCNDLRACATQIKQGDISALFK